MDGARCGADATRCALSAALARYQPCIDHLGGVVVRRLNRVYLDRLAKDSRRLNVGVHTVLLDEATAIDTLIDRAAAAVEQRGLHGEVELRERG